MGFTYPFSREDVADRTGKAGFARDLQILHGFPCLEILEKRMPLPPNAVNNRDKAVALHAFPNGNGYCC